MPSLADIPLWRFSLAGVTALAGLALSVWSIVYMKRVGKGNPFDAMGHEVAPRTRHLMTGGPYRLSRNPMLSGTYLYYLSIVLALWSGWALLVFATVATLMMLQVRSEEKRLETDFGEEYLAYKETTGRFFKVSLPFLLPIRSLAFVLIFFIGADLVGKELGEISNWWSIVATIVNVFTVLLLVYAAHRNKLTYWQLINYQKGRTRIGQILLICLVILVVGTSGMYLAGYLCYGILPYSAPMMIAPVPKLPAIINVLLLPLTTPFAEDALYLGCGVNRIKDKYTAILVPAFFFALQHCFIPTLLDGRYILYRFISFLPLTLILCWYYYKKRDPLPVMIGHGLIDVATAAQILATSTVPGLYETMCGLG